MQSSTSTHPHGHAPRWLARFLPLVCGLFLVSCVTSRTAGQAATTPEELVERGERYFDERRFEDALRSFQLAAVAVEEAGATSFRERSIHARGLAGAARSHVRLGELAEAERWQVRAERLEGDVDVVARSSILLSRGLVLQLAGEDALAESTFGELWRLAKESSLPARELQAAYMASVVSSGETQLEWGLRALDAAGGRDEWRRPILASLGWMYDRLGRTEDALDAFGEARELTDPRNPRLAIASDWQYARALRRAGRPDEARRLLLPTLLRAQERYVAGRTPNDAEWLGRCYLERAELELLDVRTAVAGGLEGQALERRIDLNRRDFDRAQRLLVEAGAAQAAPELLAQVGASLALLGEIERSVQ